MKALFFPANRVLVSQLNFLELQDAVKHDVMHQLAELSSDVLVGLSRKIVDNVFHGHGRAEGHGHVVGVLEGHFFEEELADRAGLHFVDELGALVEVDSLAGFAESLSDRGEESIFDQIVRPPAHLLGDLLPLAALLRNYLEHFLRLLDRPARGSDARVDVVRPPLPTLLAVPDHPLLAQDGDYPRPVQWLLAALYDTF